MSSKKVTKSGYSCDSFLRFGDDLSEDILSYLTFEDNFRYECISRQWHSLVFNKQNVFNFCDIFGKDLYKEIIIDLKTFESILKKCPNITSFVFNVYFDNIEEMFDLIINYCHNLTQIECDFNHLSENMIKSFTKSLDQNSRLLSYFTQLTNKINLFSDCVKPLHSSTSLNAIAFQLSSLGISF